ncbi:hypothetical protein JCM8202_001868 [Rhodotorula sphaerocarpa]
MRTPLWWLCYATWAIVSIYIAWRIDCDVPEPYMDEIFHVPQAQAYCNGDWSYWDPALTTPPGLYLIPASLAHLGRWTGLSHLLPDPCSVSGLRAFNLVLSLGLPFLYSSLLALLDPQPPSPQPAKGKPSYLRRTDAAARREWEGLVVALFPMVGWWAWMFYTDLGSVALVLLSWRAALKRQYMASAMLGAGSLSFRQTNIVWLAFIAAQAAICSVVQAEQARRPGEGGGTEADPPLRNVRLVDVVLVPARLLVLAGRHLPTALLVAAAYLPVFLAAAAFVRWNGGIVLGDKSNHVPTVHLAQVFYFLAFAGGFFAPHLASVRRTRQALVGSFRSPGRAIGSCLVLVCMAYAIRYYTIAHPFLLADNRHYAFYLWRRVINVHPVARYALVPGYFVVARLLWIHLAAAGKMSLSTLVLGLGATCAVLVPTPLLEPRYFLTPLLILRLYLSSEAGAERAAGMGYTAAARGATTTPTIRGQPRLADPGSRRRRLALEAGLYLVVQAACVWLFLSRPFQWDIRVGADGRGLEGRDERELGRWQRFMW